MFANEPHAAVEATWSVYHKIVSAYRARTPATGKAVMSKVIDTLSPDVPQALEELAEPDPTLNKRRTGILAYFDHPHTTGGPTEAINGRLEHLRGNAPGFRNPNHYTTPNPIHTGGFKKQLQHPGTQRAASTAFTMRYGCP